MLKQLILISIFTIVTLISKSQTIICWKWEFAILNPQTKSFETKAKIDLNSEAFFNNQYIRINDVKVLLTKKSIISQNKTEDGTVEIFNVISEDGEIMIATVVSDKNGIFKLMITSSIYAQTAEIYNFKNR